MHGLRPYPPPPPAPLWSWAILCILFLTTASKMNAGYGGDQRFVAPTTSSFDYPLHGQPLRPVRGKAAGLKRIAHAGARSVMRVDV